MPAPPASESSHLVRQLTSFDAQFLAIEDARNYSHVSGLSILDPSTAPGGTLNLADVQNLIEERLHLLPPFRWRLAEVPFGIDHPWWVDDPDFDIEFHVRELALPAPGNEAQLLAQIERLVSRPLDRSRPLWEIYLIQGLEKGRVALFPKIHHAVVDGVSGAEIMGILFDLEPTGRDVPPATDDGETERVPSSIELFGRGIFGTPRRVATAVASAPYILPNIADVPTLQALPGVGLIGRISDRARRVTGSNGDGQVIDRDKTKAPRTMLNGPVSAHRRISFGSLSLDTVKMIKNAYSVTVNDVVVALSAAALREFLISHNDLPDEPLIAMIPISVRTEEQIGTYGNRISMMVVPIPTDEPDPVERLLRSHDEMALAKDQFGALPANLMTDTNNFIPPAVFARAARAITSVGANRRFRPHFNVTISNVPGPPIPLYVAGAKLEANYPISVITDGVGLNITVLSYMDHLDFGIVGDRELAPDLDTIMDSLRSDLATLEKRAKAKVRAETKASKKA
ncbi:MAG: WS/DGAT/MGAT family O-acyltransferase [Solirubrobacterales bacterium]